MIPSESGERPGPEHVGGSVWWHSRVRYLFAAQLAAGRRVLDIACGNGFGTVLLAEAATSVVGADASDEAITAATRLNARPNVRWERTGAGPLPLSAGSFDLVVCLETLEHLAAPAQPAFVAELERVLAPDGVLVLSTPDRETELARARLTQEPNPYHLHTPSRAELTDLLARFPHRLEFVELDVIATAIVPAAEGASLTPEVAWTPRERAAPVSVLHVCARTDEGLARARALRGPIVCRSDYQRLVELGMVLSSRRVPDLGGLPLDEQVALLAERVRRLDDEVERVHADGARVARDVHLLNETLSVDGWVARLRRLRARITGDAKL